MTNTPIVELFYDNSTNTATYLVYNRENSNSIIIDSVLDYNPESGILSTTNADLIINRIAELNLANLYILETHAHADHITAAPYLKKHVGGSICIGEHITASQKTFSGIFNLGDDFHTDGSQFDLLLSEGDTLDFGDLSLKVMHTPGHTPGCSSYIIDDMIFVGDVIFMPDFGSARCDFPSGDAAVLYDSIQKIFALPDETRVFVGHDYAPGGRKVMVETTIKAERETNIHFMNNVTKSDFVDFRKNRDATLSAPRLLYPSVQMNINAGELPIAEENGAHYLKIPLTFETE